jgi:hypothetical protein
VFRRDQTRVAKKFLESKPDARRKLRIPKLTWLENVENDLRQLKVERLRKMANNIEEWVLP